MTEYEKRESDGLPVAEILFWAVAVIILFWGLGDRHLWGSEGRWAEICREMLLTRNYFHPQINGETYFDKPLLSYWAILAVSWVTGCLNEWVARVPSAIAGLVALWGTVSIGKRLWNHRTGYLAGWIMLTAYGFIFWSRVASADMWNVAFIVAAVAWYWRFANKPNFFFYLVFYLICFIGSNMKGLPALIIPIAVIMPDILTGKRWEQHLKPLNIIFNVIAFAIGVAVYLFPFYLDPKEVEQLSTLTTIEANKQSGLYMIFQENIQRFFKALDHQNPFYIYIYKMPALFLPWSPLLLVGFIYTLVKFWDFTVRCAKPKFNLLGFIGKFLKDWDEARYRYWIFAAVIIIFTIFTLSSSRRGYYIIPILPFAALLTADYLRNQPVDIFKSLILAIMELALLIFAAATLFTPFVWVAIYHFLPPFFPPILTVVITPLLGVLIIILWLMRRADSPLLNHLAGFDKTVSAIVLSMALLMGGLFCFHLNIGEKYRTEKPFALALKEFGKDVKPENFYFYLKTPDKAIFYLGLTKPVSIVKSEEDFQKMLKSKNAVLITWRKFLETDKYGRGVYQYLPKEMHGKFNLREKIQPWEKKKKHQRDKLVVWKIQGVSLD